jgi:omega-6 fatty acid desaturase (delta-12 desaturase)
MGVMRAGFWPWASTMGTNLAIAVVTGCLIWAVGPGSFFLVQLPITLIAGAVGIWLFFIQHQFEETYWEEGKEWNFHSGAIHGSSHYDLPAVLRWFTANVGIHHVHHLASRIPFYRLRQVLRDFPELRERGRLTLLTSFRSAKLALWDQVGKRLISFREASTLAA